MPDLGAGPLLWEQQVDTNKFVFTPTGGASAIVRDIRILTRTFPETWNMEINGQDMGPLVAPTTPVMNPLRFDPFSSTLGYTLPAYMRDILGRDLTYFVGNRETLTISSVGGSTATVQIAYEEVNANAVAGQPVNSSGAKRWLGLRWAQRLAPVTVAGDTPFDTEYGLDFAPNIFLDGAWETGWTASILALFLTTNSVNTFNGSADHISRTLHLALTLNGQDMFTRADSGGIPMLAMPANTGNANESWNDSGTPFPWGRDIYAPPPTPLPAPIILRPGYNARWRLHIDGDVTGGADYQHASILAIVEYVQG